MKHHLVRLLGISILTYEEMTTILCQIEQVLKHRPLMDLTKNADNILALAKLPNRTRSLIWNLSSRWDKMVQGRTHTTFIDVNVQEYQTRRERLKSALYLRLKKRKTFFWKKLEIFEKKIFFRKMSQCRKM